MDSKRPDELARTATALAESGETPRPPISPVGAVIGRYRLERQLGAGGMGVVHAAFDPDLERRVALKVLRTSGTEDGQKRLLREARAMARLAHANVIVVHEVGSADDRDYVAMELIDGETLADWLRREKRARAAVLDAFVAAGRGLAAAHAEGIIHRDFKPHNVLRSHKGRIVVTDFGLAREATLAAPDERTAPATTTSSALSALTATGSVIGTPAYMAPEQWDGGAVTQATDQFGFCVALWEALTGERPYRGPTVEDLRTQVAAGPQALDASKIPRRLRTTLLRGLDPDPAKRWPSMDALLRHLLRAERRPVRMLAAGGAAVVIAGVIGAVMIPGGSPGAAPCSTPLLAPSAVWSLDAAARLIAANQGLAATRIAADMVRWQAARAGACKAEPIAREPRLRCLDGVLLRIDVNVGALATVHGGEHVDPGGTLIDPAVCDGPAVPRLMTAASRGFRFATAAMFTAQAGRVDADPESAQHAMSLAADDPCASAYAHFLVAVAGESPVERKAQMDISVQEAQRCDDDRVRAELAIFALQGPSSTNEILGNTMIVKLRTAEGVVERVAQPDLIAELDMVRMLEAEREDNVDEAIRLAERAAAGYAARGRSAKQIDAGLAAIALRQSRSRPEDLAMVAERFAQLRAIGAVLGPSDSHVRELRRTAAALTWMQGDLAAAHAELDTLGPLAIRHPHTVSGRVLDRHGAPVAGAHVFAGLGISGDAMSPAIELDAASAIRTAITGTDGTYRIAAPDLSVVLAQHGDLRSISRPIAEHVDLELRPTGQISGHLDMRGKAIRNVVMVATHFEELPDDRYRVYAPVGPDGSFRFTGVVQGKVRVQAMQLDIGTSVVVGTTVELGPTSVTAVDLVMPTSTRIVHVLVRSTVAMSLPSAQAFVFPGKVKSMSLAAMIQSQGDLNAHQAHAIERELPAAISRHARAGDLLATVKRAPAGEVSACAIGFPAELSLDEMNKLSANMDKIQVACVTLSATEGVVAIEVPPFPRL